MSHFIRGFSQLTGYYCLQCHMKCCSTEYDLPIFKKEKEKLFQDYPFLRNFIKSSKKKSSIIRGDSCPLLSEDGLCFLHKKEEKPLICQVYPLIFYKIKHDLVLVWISPCRGNGFEWVSKPENQIGNRYIDKMIKKTNPYYTEYFGEEIDKNNPYSSIPITRIDEHERFLTELSQNNEIIDLYNRNYPNHNNIVHSLVRKMNDLPYQEDLNKIINSVFHWLYWSPVGLQLSLNHCLFVFQIAGYWTETWGRKLLIESKLLMKRERILQQLGSFYATSILPSFWKHIMKNTPDKSLKRFSQLVYLVLKGTKSQEILQETIYHE